MRTTQLLLPTLKEVPADAEVISHQLMLRAGMIRKLASGLYTWLPLGLRVLKKVEQIVREEMNRAGAQELLMTAVQPAELWQETGRWDKFGPQLLKLKDRHEREFCFGPTNEEIITDLMRRELKSYKQLPLILYQIQTKFRDEIRPRFGVMRAREFLMKDAYSFHIDFSSMQQGYELMYQTYSRIFDRLGLRYRAVLADTGSIGGKHSHEFHVLADSGEDLIFYSDSSDYAANIEFAETVRPQSTAPQTLAECKLMSTPNCVSVDEAAQCLNISADSVMKTLLVAGVKSELVAILLRGNHELNLIKAEKHPLVAKPIRFATPDQIERVIGCKAGSIGPMGLKIPVIADYAVAAMHNFACGANQHEQHYIGVNWERDVALPEVADLRNVEVGDPSPDNKGRLQMARGIEVGHVFQLGDNYSKAMGLTVNNEAGERQIVYMGTYGIGVSRIVAAAIEQNHDQWGIIWPPAIAPFHVALISLNSDKSEQVRFVSQQLYDELTAAGIEVLWDDRVERPGVMFAEMDLIGIPYHIVVSERGLAQQQQLEVKHRATNQKEIVGVGGVLARVKQLLS